MHPTVYGLIRDSSSLGSAKTNKMNKEYLYNWIFNFNPYTQEYQAVKRENYNDLFSNISKVVSAETVAELEEIIQRSGDLLV